MCILILIKKGEKIKKEQIKNCLLNNPDGEGVGYFVNNKLVIEKQGKQDFKTSLKFITGALETAYQQATSDILLHFRVATGSVCNKINAHPFKLNKETIIGHNGILNYIKSFEKVSDTRILLKLLQSNLLTEKDFNKICGINNKFIFLKKDTSIIVNEEFGQWENNIWFSNNTYKYIFY